MAAFLFAVYDPDLNLPPSLITYVREKVSFPHHINLIEVFILLSSTIFSHIPYLLSRGLDLVIFNGKLEGSDQIISISISDSDELWHSLIEDFSRIFHVTFHLHRSQKPIPEERESERVALYEMFLSPPDRQAIRLAKESNEKGEYLPLSRSEWCLLSSQRTTSHQPFLEKQWDSTVNILFRENEIRFTKAVVQERSHALYIFLERFCLLLSRLNFRWSKIVAADSSFASSAVLSKFLVSNSSGGFSNQDDENQINN